MAGRGTHQWGRAAYLHSVTCTISSNSDWCLTGMSEPRALCVVISMATTCLPLFMARGASVS